MNISTFFRKNIQNKLTLYISFSLLIISLYPYAISGFFFDDIYNSVTKGAEIYQSHTHLQSLLYNIKHWIIEEGRFFPLSVMFGDISWHYFDDTVSSKLLQLTIIIINCIVFYKITSELKGQRFARISVALLPVFFQFNPRWDGISSFIPLMPILCTLILLTWLYAIRDRTIYTSLFSILSLLTYELGILSLIGWLTVVLNKKSKSRTNIITIVLILTSYVSLYGFFRLNRSLNYDGIQLALSLKSILATFTNQLISGFPLSSLNNNILEVDYLDLGLFVFILIFFFSTSYFFIFKHDPFYLSKNDQTAEENNKITILLSALLSIVPAALIAASAKYQNIISLGDPYIVIYIQYYGLSILCTTLISRQLSKIANNRLYFLSFLLAILATITIQTNIKRINIKNIDFKLPREAMESFINKGLIDDKEKINNIVVKSPYLWEQGTLCSYFMSHHLKKPISCIDYNEIFKTQEAHFILYRNESSIKFIDSVTKKVSVTDVTLNTPSFKLLKHPSASEFIFQNFGDGFYGWEKNSDGLFAWSSGNSNWLFLNTISDNDFTIQFALQSAQPQEILFSLDHKVVSEQFTYSGEIRNISENFHLKKGINTLGFTPQLPPVKLPPDQRDFAFRVINMTITSR